MPTSMTETELKAALADVARTLYNLENWLDRRRRVLAETGKHDAFALDAVPSAIRLLKDYEQELRKQLS